MYFVFRITNLFFTVPSNISFSQSQFYFSNFSSKHVVGSYKKHLAEVLLISTYRYNIRFCEKKKKIIHLGPVVQNQKRH